MGLISNSLQKFRRSLAVCLAFMVMVPMAAAETVAVISLKPSGQLFSDVEYLMGATGTGALAQFFMPQIKAQFQGIDQTRPIGVVVSLEEGEFSVLGFLPVTDMDTVLSNLEPHLGEAEDAGDGVLELKGPQPMFVKEKGGWAFIGQTVASLQSLPRDPVTLLDGMHKQYVVGIRGMVKNIPDQYKQMVLQQARSAFESNVDDPKAAEAQVKQLEVALNESDQVTLGWQIDPERRETHFEGATTALPGTQLAKQIDAMREAKTDFGGFLVEGAAIRGNITSLMTPEQVEQSLAGLRRVEQKAVEEVMEDDDLDEASRRATVELVKTFFRIADSTLKSGRVDSCTSVILKGKNVSIISAGHVADGREVEEAVRKLVQVSENQGPDELSLSDVKFNAASHAGVSFHTLAVPVPDEEKARQVLGESIPVTIGTAADSAYIAVGTDGLDYLKRHIDASQQARQQTVDPVYGEVALMPILKFAESIQPNPILRSLTQMVSDQPDRLLLQASVTDDDAARYRLTLQEGVLSLLGQAVQMAGVAGAGGQ